MTPSDGHQGNHRTCSEGDGPGGDAEMRPGFLWHVERKSLPPRRSFRPARIPLVHRGARSRITRIEPTAMICTRSPRHRNQGLVFQMDFPAARPATPRVSAAKAATAAWARPNCSWEWKNNLSMEHLPCLAGTRTMRPDSSTSALSANRAACATSWVTTTQVRPCSRTTF